MGVAMLPQINPTIHKEVKIPTPEIPILGVKPQPFDDGKHQAISVQGANPYMRQNVEVFLTPYHKHQKQQPQHKHQYQQQQQQQMMMDMIKQHSEQQQQQQRQQQQQQTNAPCLQQRKQQQRQMQPQGAILAHDSHDNGNSLKSMHVLMKSLARSRNAKVYSEVVQKMGHDSEKKIKSNKKNAKDAFGGLFHPIDGSSIISDFSSMSLVKEDSMTFGI